MTALERRSVVSLSLLYIFRMLGLFMVLPLLALYAVDYADATPALIGLALGIYGLTQALLQIPLGWLSDRVGRKRVILAGLLLFAAGSVIAALADSVAGIILGRALQGAGAIAGTVLALLADLTRDEQRTKAMALVGISIGMSFAIALVLGPAVAAVGGLSGVFWFAGGLALVGIVILLAWVPAPPPEDPRRHADVGARRGLILQSLLDPGLARFNLGVFVLHFVLMASFLVLPGLLQEIAAIDRQQHWQVYLPVMLLSLAGMIPLMGLAERRQRPRLAFLLGVACIALALLVVALRPAVGPLYAALWLFFVGFNYLEATLPSQVSKQASVQGKGTALGVYSTCQFLGAFCGGAAGGWMVQYWGPGALLGACVLMCALWATVHWRSRGLEPALEQPVPGAQA